jgi:putative restriction endonuclease
VANQYERAYRAWQILIQFATKKDDITYGQLAHGLGIHHRPVRFVLDRIQSYCLEERLPPLTILVVNQTTRSPGSGFIAWDVNNIEQGKEQVYNFPWSSIENPFSFAADNTLFNSLVTSITQNPEQSEEVYAKVKVRGMAQIIFRNALLRAYGRRCAFTGLQFIPCLDAAHIVPWSESTHSQRMDIRNGILLSSIHHRLFDNNLITIDEEYRIRFYDSSMTEHTPYSDYDKLLTSHLHGRPINLPSNHSHWPKLEWIQQRNSKIKWLNTG